MSGSLPATYVVLYDAQFFTTIFRFPGSGLTHRARVDCTFLGPSRKRGPPKGYIDAIEARLHQTEALVGILLAANDSRARGLLDDLSQVKHTVSNYLLFGEPCSNLDVIHQDPLAHEIIQRVDSSPYGVKGRARAAESSSASSKARLLPAGVKTKSDSPNPSIHAAQSVFFFMSFFKINSSHFFNLFPSPAHQQNGRSASSTVCPTSPRLVGKPFSRPTAPPRSPPLVLAALPCLSL